LEKTNSEIQKKYYSLLELTQSIESVIKKTYTKSYWVKAEIAKLNYYPKSGHCYPDMVEKEKGVVRAQIRGTIWAGQFNDINTKFLSVTKEPLSDGMTVLIRTSVTYHPVYGLGLQIIDIEPSFTLGELAKEKMLSIEKLKSHGIFNRNKQLEPALLFKRIAIISVETSKGYHDFLKIIDNNEWNYTFLHKLFPALLQGSGAIKSISEQLKRIAGMQNNFDAVIIIRGGGGDIGLSSFDSFELAKAVSLFPLPVVTGIGHATNETVVEMISFINKITPTDVGYYLIQKFHNFSVRIQDAHNLLTTISKQIFINQNIKLKNIGAVIISKTDALINENKYRLAETVSEFKSISIATIEKNRNYLTNSISKLSNNSFHYSKANTKQLSEQQKRLCKSTKISFHTNNLKLNTLSEKVKLLNPLNILKRGYSITTMNGKAILNTRELKVDDIVITKIFDGSFKSKVQSVEN